MDYTNPGEHFATLELRLVVRDLLKRPNGITHLRLFLGKLKPVFTYVFDSSLAEKLGVDTPTLHNEYAPRVGATHNLLTATDEDLSHMARDFLKRGEAEITVAKLAQQTEMAKNEGEKNASKQLAQKLTALERRIELVNAGVDWLLQCELGTTYVHAIAGTMLFTDEEYSLFPGSYNVRSMTQWVIYFSPSRDVLKAVINRKFRARDKYDVVQARLAMKQKILDAVADGAKSKIFEGAMHFGKFMGFADPFKLNKVRQRVRDLPELMTSEQIALVLAQTVIHEADRSIFETSTRLPLTLICLEPQTCGRFRLTFQPVKKTHPDSFFAANF